MKMDCMICAPTPAGGRLPKHNLIEAYRGTMGKRDKVMGASEGPGPWRGSARQMCAPRDLTNRPVYSTRQSTL